MNRALLLAAAVLFFPSTSFAQARVWGADGKPVPQKPSASPSAPTEDIWSEGKTHCFPGQLERYKKDEFGHQAAEPDKTDQVTLCWSLSMSDPTNEFDARTNRVYQGPAVRILKFSIRTHHFIGGDAVETSEWLPVVKSTDSDVAILFAGKLNSYGDDTAKFWLRNGRLTARIGTSHDATYVTVTR
jgi:hypothetical protein